MDIEAIVKPELMRVNVTKDASARRYGQHFYCRRVDRLPR